MKKYNQTGVAQILIILLVLVVVGATVLVELRVANRSKQISDSTAASSVQTKFQSQADLKAANSQLDNLSEPDPAQLDSDIQSLL